MMKALLPSSSGSISTIAVSPTDPDRVVFGTSNGFVFRSSMALSSDKDTVWVSSRPRSGFLFHLAFDPVHLYATYSRYKSDLSQSHVY
jgi:hypothetical protein